MSIQNQIEQAIRQDFSVLNMQIYNESSKHAGSSTESHFKLVLVADEFTGLSLLKRQQLVYKTLAKLMPQFHALGLHTYSLGEWDNLQAVPKSPKCSGSK